MLRLLGMVLLGSLRAITARASSITWSAPENMADSSDDVTSGILVGAYRLGGAAISSAVNGALFPPFSLSDSGGTTGNFVPCDDLPPEYRAILGNGFAATGSGSYLTLTLNALVPGQAYTLQAWANESRSAINPVIPTSSYNYFTAITVFLDLNTGSPEDGEDGGTGQYVVGSFIASGGEHLFQPA